MPSPRPSDRRAAVEPRTPRGWPYVKNFIRPLPPHRRAGAGPLPSAPMRISRKLAALAAFFVIGAAVAGCGSSIPGNSVAVVAGNPITLQAFNHWLYVAAKEETTQAAEEGETIPVIVPDPPSYKGCIAQIRAGIPALAKTPRGTLLADCKNQFNSDASTVMNFLIEGYWFQAEAYKLGIKAPNLIQKFNKTIKKQFPAKGSFASYLKSSGFTKQDLIFQDRVQTLYSKLVKRHETKATSAAIAAYYKKHKSQYGTAETRDVHLVRTKTESSAQAAYDALKSGQSWDAVAKQYATTTAAKANGGLLSGVSSGQEENAANKAIFGSPVNKVVGPVKGLLGYYVLEVTKINAATQETLAQATKSIKSLLEQDAQTKAESKVMAIVKKAWMHRTTCRSPYESTYCSNYKKPATVTAPASTTTTPASTSTTSNTTTTGSTSTTGSTTTATATTASTTTTK